MIPFSFFGYNKTTLVENGVVAPQFMFDELICDGIFQQLSDLKSFVNFSATSKMLFKVSQNTVIAKSHCFELNQFIFIRNVDYNNSVNLDVNAETFYQLFNQRCKKLKIDTNDQNFNFCMLTAVKHMRKVLGQEFHGKARKIAIEFGDKIYRDMISSYADRAANEITMGSFTSKVAQIKALFPTIMTIVDVETSLRQAILKKHSSEKFVQFSENYFFSLVNKSGEFIVRKKRYENELMSKVVVLCGTGDKHKMKDEAHAQMIEANHLLNEAKVTYLDYVGPYGQRQFSTIEGVLKLIAMFSKYKDPNAKLQLMGQKFGQLHAQYEEAKVRFENLGVVCSALDHLDTDFEHSFAKIYKFYNEISQVVTLDNKDERHIALHKILQGK